MSPIYLVRFFKKADPEKPRDKDMYLGSVEVDLLGVSNDLTLTGKAFRQAPPQCLYADKVKVERVS